MAANDGAAERDGGRPGERAPARLIRRGLKLRHFRLFAALDETGQISAAAASLGISQPAASRLAAEAEQIVGAPLYRRTNRGVALTEAGGIFARRGRRSLMEIEAAERELSEIAPGNGGAVRIGSVTGPAVEHVLPAAERARQRSPRLHISIEIATSDLLNASLLAGDLDFILARLPADADPNAYQARFIGPEPISVIARIGHPLLERPHCDVRDLLDHDWVLPPRGTPLRATVEKAIMYLGAPPPQTVLDTSSFLLTLMTLTRSDALAAVAAPVAGFFERQCGGAGLLGAVSLSPPMAVEPYALIRVADRELTAAAQAMHDAIASELDALRASA